MSQLKWIFHFVPTPPEEVDIYLAYCLTEQDTKLPHVPTMYVCAHRYPVPGDEGDLRIVTNYQMRANWRVGNECFLHDGVELTYANGYSVCLSERALDRMQPGVYKPKGTDCFLGYASLSRMCAETMAAERSIIGDGQTNPGMFAGDYNQHEDNIMTNSSELITIVQLENGAKVVSAEYLDGTSQPYHFKNVVGVDLQPGDLIVGETRDTFELLRVLDPDVLATEVGIGLGQLKHVVAKVKNAAYMDVKAAEAQAVRKIALSEVTAKLSTFREQVGDGTFDRVQALLTGKVNTVASEPVYDAEPYDPDEDPVAKATTQG